MSFPLDVSSIMTTLTSMDWSSEDLFPATVSLCGHVPLSWMVCLCMSIWLLTNITPHLSKVCTVYVINATLCLLIHHKPWVEVSTLCCFTFKWLACLIKQLCFSLWTITSYTNPASQLDLTHDQLTQWTFTGYMNQARLDSLCSDLLLFLWPCSFASNSFTRRPSALIAHFFHALAL